MACSASVPLGRWTLISTNSAVLSSTFCTLILPLSFAATMESWMLLAVVPKGSSVIFTMFRRGIAREQVAPVPLRIDEQLLLPELRHGVADARIPVRMILHGVAHHVRDLVVAPILQLTQ